MYSGFVTNMNSNDVGTTKVHFCCNVFHSEHIVIKKIYFMISIEMTLCFTEEAYNKTKYMRE